MDEHLLADLAADHVRNLTRQSASSAPPKPASRIVWDNLEAEFSLKEMELDSQRPPAGHTAASPAGTYVPSIPIPAENDGATWRELVGASRKEGRRGKLCQALPAEKPSAKRPSVFRVLFHLPIQLCVGVRDFGRFISDR